MSSASWALVKTKTKTKTRNKAKANLLRISRRQPQSSKPSAGPTWAQGPVQTHRLCVQEAGPDPTRVPWFKRAPIHRRWQFHLGNWLCSTSQLLTWKEHAANFGLPGGGLHREGTRLPLGMACAKSRTVYFLELKSRPGSTSHLNPASSQSPQYLGAIFRWPVLGTFYLQFSCLRSGLHRKCFKEFNIMRHTHMNRLVLVLFLLTCC